MNPKRNGFHASEVLIFGIIDYSNTEHDDRQLAFGYNFKVLLEVLKPPLSIEKLKDEKKIELRTRNWLCTAWNPSTAAPGRPEERSSIAVVPGNIE